ncbi:hypothetical protein ANCCEY_14451 [Ancylostoma ceylanicum]|uniref:DH domain-containing protein n=1 Tax=Ancylostoma ceylanicum TaxID=53326 RepID=A0A0D6L6J4_9BILA|nr:hypothetical protein ANCCEY_14451 [Ancylostoma ceylanicum]
MAFHQGRYVAATDAGREVQGSGRGSQGSNAAVEGSGPDLYTDYTQASDEGSHKDAALKFSRAHHVCLELFETDVSYLNALKLLAHVKAELEEAIEKGDPVMEKSDVSVVFGKIPAILYVHEKIISTLKGLLENWDEESAAANISQVWIDAYEELDRVYTPYSNIYDTARSALIAADGANPRVHAFIRAKEYSVEFKRNRFQDLLIRPVQRLPTIVVLLKGYKRSYKKETISSRQKSKKQLVS